MIELRDDPHSNIVELTVDGNISKEEFDDLIARLRAKVREHGKVRLLEHVRSMGTIPASRFWEDMKFAFKHMNHFSHAAVVGDQRWLALFTKLVQPLVPCEVRYFPEDRLEQARAWLREGMPRREEQQPSAT